ncbi:MAG: nitroreductase family protein [Lachnospiraceae bacterium]|nr:nitroreductase family protein [Lachnospiraceae bacterium]
MKRNYNYPGIFETLHYEQNEETAVSIRQDFSTVLKRKTIMIFMLAASLAWCFSVPVRAEDASTEENNTEEAGKEETTEANDQNVSEQIEDFISSLQNEENETDDQDITAQIEDFINSFQNGENETDSQGDDVAERIKKFISTFQNEENETDNQDVAGQLEDFLSSLLTESGEADTQTAAELVEDIPTTQYFTDDPVADDDIEAILNAGINSPSAMNSQSWHFSVITDTSLLQQISDEMSSMMASSGGFSSNTAISAEITEESDRVTLNIVSEDIDETGNTDVTNETEEGIGSATVTKAGIADAPLAIVISCADGSELDAGIACQTMSIEAQLLGYGSKIISSPTSILNGENQEEYQELLGIPDGYSAAAILLVGQEDTSVDETMDGYTSATTRNSQDDMVTYIEP